jgi:HK97 family phage portal protein
VGVLATVRQKVGGWLIGKAAPRTLSGVDDSRGWFSLSSIGGFFDGTTRAWQRDEILVDQDSLLSQSTIFACITLIAADIGKLCLKLVERDANGIWAEVQSPAFSPVLRKPNGFQTMQLFIEQWVFSLLNHGNAYILKERDQRGVVVRMFVLDPNRVRPLVAQDGSVYYQLQEDDLSGVTESVPAAPASEIIHDRINCLFHPLVGISPIFACALAATQALRIQRNSAKFFENMSRPSGILTAPAQISDEVANRLKTTWQQNYGGENVGKVAVLGDGLTYTAMSVNPIDAQLVEQLKLSAEQVCAVFHVPAYMVGAAAVPANNNVEALYIKYFGQCLQKYIRRIEDGLDDGMGLTNVPGKVLGTMFDLDDLLRMDSSTLTTTLKDQVGAGITAPNEARQRLNLGPVAGGASPLLQQQNFSLAALAKRDASPDPFGKASTTPAPAPAPEPEPMKAAEPDQTSEALHLLFRKAPEELLHA